jgi:oligopeptide transport system substrate-binding protein
LAEAGYPNGRGFPLVDCRTWHGSKPSDDFLHRQWRENLGVEIAWQSLESSRFFTELTQEPQPQLFPLVFGSSYPDPDGYLRDTFPWQLTGWHNASYARLIEKARRLTDQRQRVTLYAEADRILAQEAPIVPLMYVRYHTLVKPWVQNYPGPWKDVIIEPH